MRVRDRGRARVRDAPPPKKAVKRPSRPEGGALVRVRVRVIRARARARDRGRVRFKARGRAPYP